MQAATRQATQTRDRVRVPTSLLFWSCGVLGGWLFLMSLLSPGSLLYFRSNFFGGVTGIALAFLTLPVLRWHAAIAFACSLWLFLSVTFWSPMNHLVVESSTTLAAGILALTGAVAVLQLEVISEEAPSTSPAKKPPLL